MYCFVVCSIQQLDLAAVVGCLGMPTLVLFLLRIIDDEKISSDVKKAARFSGILPMILNSVINPIIYTVKNKQFRIAFIEMLLKKSYQDEASTNEGRLFGPRTTLWDHKRDDKLKSMNRLSRMASAEIKNSEKKIQDRTLKASFMVPRWLTETLPAPIT